jgi:hypothetical protein
VPGSESVLEKSFDESEEIERPKSDILGFRDLSF